MKIKLKSFTVYFKDLRIFNRIFGKWLIMAGEVNEMTYRRLLRVKTYYKVIVNQAALHKTPSFHLISSRGNFVETQIFRKIARNSGETGAFQQNFKMRKLVVISVLCALTL